MKTQNRFLAMLLSFVMLISGLCGSSISVFAEDNDIVKLSVTYHLNSEDGNMIAEPYYADMPKGSEYSVASPEIENYVLSNQEQKIIQGTLNEDTNIEVVYTYDDSKEVSYKINYIGVDSKGKETTLDTVTDKAPVDTVVSIPFKEFKGYYKRSGEDMKLTVTSDGKAEKNVYYDKTDKPYIIFNTNGSYIEPIMAEAGDDISDKIADIKEPTRRGYTFAGWDKEFPKTMPAEDYIVNAKWDADESNYTVLYWFENAEDDNYTLNTEQNITRMATTESKVTATEEDKQKADTTDTDNDFYGFDYSHADTVTVNGDGNTVLNIYYKREIWKVNLYNNLISEELTVNDCKDIMESSKSLWKSFSGKYGSKLPEDFPTTAELREYYTDLNTQWKDLKWNGMIDLPTSMDESDNGNPATDKMNELKTFSAVNFDYESGKGTHIAEVFPYFRHNENDYNIYYYGQSLDLTNYELKQHRIIPAIYSTASLTPIPPEGFTTEGATYRTSANYEDMLQKEWSNYVSGKITVWYYAEVRFPRVKNTLTFNSDNTPVKTVDNVYYETDLTEELKYEPENTDNTRKFAGWYYSADEFDLRDPLTSITMPSTALTLYAKWEPVDRTVTFDTQGGTSVDSQTVPHNGKATLPTEPIKTGYEFTGWYTSADGDERWSFDRPVDDDTILYAHWRSVSKTSYTVRHIMQGETQPFFEETIDGGVGDTIVALPLDPKHENYPKDIYLKADNTSQTVVLDKDTNQNILTFTYIEVAQKDYTVKYLNKQTNEPVAEPKTVTTKNTVVTEQAVNVDNLKVDGNTSVTQNIKENGEIIFYYVPVNLTVSYQFQSGTDGKELPEAVTSLVPMDNTPYTYGDTVTVKTPTQDVVTVDGGQWIFKGYGLQENKFTIKENTVITGTWEFARNAEVINHIPVITAKDKIFKVGDTFDNSIALQDVTAYDEEDGDVTDSLEVIDHNVDTSTAGTYFIIYKATDSQGVSSTKTVNVYVYPVIEPVNRIPVITAEDKTFKVGDTFNDEIALKDVTAYDEEDGDVTSSLEIVEHNVDTSTAGTYFITYKATDSKGASSTKTVNVYVYPVIEPVNRIPVITAEDKTFKVGDTFNDEIALKDVTAYDEEDGDVTSSLEIVEHNVDTSTAGTYFITYKATDSKGASGTKTVNVYVYPTLEPVNRIPVITAEDKTLTVGDSFDVMAGVTALDKEDGDITKNIEVIKNEVKTDTAGVYEVTYKVTDKDGASTTKTIYVTVNPKIEGLNEVPTINAEDKTLTVGDSFDAMKDVTASDKEDGDLTAKIEVIENTVDTSKASTYTVTYKVTDKDGASTTKTITVTVKDKDKEEQPTAPTKPDKGDNNNNDKNNTASNADKTDTSVKTGDSTNVLLWSMATIISLAGVMTALFFKRRRSK